MIKINKRITLLFILVLTVLLATSIVSATDSNSTSDSSSTSLDDSNTNHYETNSKSVTTQEVKTSSNIEDVKSNDNEITTNTDSSKELTTSTHDNQDNSQQSSNTCSTNNSKDSSATKSVNYSTTKTSNDSEIKSVNNSTTDTKTELKQATSTATDYNDLKTKTESGSYSTINLDNSLTYKSTGVIYITSDLTIEGNGATINGTQHNVFMIFKGNVVLKNIIFNNCSCAVNNTSNLTLSGCTFENCYYDIDYVFSYPGAVSNTGTLSIDNCNFKNNTVYSGGGAIYNEGNMTIKNSYFTDNKANRTEGGAIYNHKANVTITNSVFTNNSAINGTGGAIYNYNVNCTISDCTFTNNKAKNASAIYTEYFSNIEILNSLIDNNNATNGSGAIYNYYKVNMTLSNSIITNNYASNKTGGAIYNDYDVILNIKNSELNYNNATNGGAIYNSNGVNLNISNSELNDNEARNGGAIYNIGDISLVVTNSLFTNNYAGNGSAIYNYNLTNTTIKNSIFSNNSAGQNGTLYYQFSKGITLDNITFDNNSARFGEAIFNDESNITISNSLFTNYNNTDVYGYDKDGFPDDKLSTTIYPLYNRNNAIMTIINATITDNIGKFMYNENCSTINMTKSKIYSNTQFFINNINYSTLIISDLEMLNNEYYFGSAINNTNYSHVNINGNFSNCNFRINNINNSDININNSNFNNVTGYIVYNDRTSNVTAKNTNITQHQSTLFYNYGNLTIDNCTINDNKYEIVVTSGFSNTTVINSTLNGNYGDRNGGALYNSVNSTMIVVTSEICNNDATNGGAIYNLGNITIFKCIFTNNTALNKGTTLYNSGYMELIGSKVNDDEIYNIGTLIVIKIPDTKLTISTSPDNPSVGEVVLISGTLNDEDNNPLAQKTVSLTIGNMKVTVLTNSYGVYNYQYITDTVGNISVTANFDGGNEYFSSSASTSFIVYQSASNIVVSPVTTKNGYTVVLTANITDSNGKPVNVGQATFKLNGVTIKVNGTQIKVDVVNGIAQYNFTVPNYSAKDYNLTAVYGYLDTRLEDTTVFTIIKSDPELKLTSITSNGTIGQITGVLLDEHGFGVDRDTKVAVKINGKTILSTRIYEGMIDLIFDTSAYKTGIHNLTIIFGENGCYNTVTFNGIIAQNIKDTIIVQNATGKNGEVVSFTAYIIDENGNTLNNGTATFKLNSVTIKENGTQLLLNVVNGVATYDFTIPDYSAKDYNLTAVASIGGTRYEAKSVLTIQKSDTHLDLSDMTISQGSNAILRGQILDEHDNLVTLDTKVAVKINGKTVVNTRVYDGLLNISLDTQDYSSGTYNVTVIAGENGRYNTSTDSTTLSIVS